MSADSKASNSKFLKGTLILTASSIVVKVIGSLNWIIYHVYWVAKVSVCIRWAFQSI